MSYQVYGSTDPAVPATAGNLLATTTSTSYLHAGLGLETSWHYRVRAVDAAGNTGPPSGVVSATTGHTLQIEAETLLPALSGTAPAEVQGSCCGVQWSGGAQLWIRPTAAGQELTLGVPVSQAGSYRITAIQTQAGDYGIDTLAVDGAVTGAPFDGYHTPGVVIAPPVDYGTVDLTAGTHRFTVTATGKNAAATGFLVGIDAFRLTLVDR